MKRVVLGLAAALALPGAVRAGECLTASDLGSGIRAEFHDGSQTDYRAGDGGLVAVMERPDPAHPSGIAFVSRLGLYDLEAAEVEDGQTSDDHRLLMRYSVGFDQLPTPKAGDSWVGTTTTTYPDGQSDVADAIYVFGRAETVDLGGCRYQAVPVKASFVWADGWMAQEFVYLTDLGIGIIVGSQYSSEPGPARYLLAGLSRIAP